MIIYLIKAFSFALTRKIGSAILSLVNANDLHLHKLLEDTKMRKIKIIIIAVLAIILTTGCSANNTNQTDTQVETDAVSIDDEKIQVVTTLFPQYDFTRAIGGDKVEVSLLLPPGVEAHSYEPTPQDVVSISQADIFIYTGEGMEPWAHKTIEGIDAIDLRVVDSSQNIELLTSDHDHDEEFEDEEHEEEEHEDGEYDPHIWTNPLNAIIMVDNILKALVEVDPTNAEFYTANAEAYKTELEKLDADIAEGLSTLETRTIIFGGHFAFGYFAHQYEMEYVSPYEGFSPDAEPTPQKIAEMIDLMNSLQVKTIFYEELLDPKVSRVIAEETGANMELLHAAHNVSKEELEQGVTYITIMRENLERLIGGLNGK